MNLFPALCAAKSNFAIDIIVIVFFVAMGAYHGTKGFVRCIFSLLSTAIAVIGSIFLARTVMAITGGLFGLDDVFASKFESIFAKLDGFNVDVTATTWKETLKSQDVSAALSQLVVKMIGGSEELPVGTTVASLLGDAIGPLSVMLILSVIIFIVVKIALFFIKHVVENIVDNVELVKSVDMTVGIIFGVLYAFLIVCGILALLILLPIESMSGVMAKTWFVGGLYEHNPLIAVLNWFI